jgi:hypothetical protein
MVEPVPVIVPTVAFPPTMPSTDQVTVVVANPVTVAVKDTDEALAMVVALGLRDTCACKRGWTVTTEEALLLVSAVLVARMV